MNGGGPASVQLIVIGAGFGGIGLGIRLKQSGFDDFVILEKSDSAGGVWYANSYPGAACDVPSHLYSFSFEPRPDWPDKYATQARYPRLPRRLRAQHGLERHIRYRTEVIEARWDESSSRWRVRTRDGNEMQAQAIVAATGQLSRPFRPSLPGIERFAGTLFHSAEWRHDYDMRGKRIAVIGTGASAVQFVPAIAPHVGNLCVFQRSAPYILPKPDRKYPSWQKRLFGRIGAVLRLSRVAIYLQHEAPAFAFVMWPAALRVKRRAFRDHLRRGVKNPERQQRLIPPLCDWLQAHSAVQRLLSGDGSAECRADDGSHQGSHRRRHHHRGRHGAAGRLHHFRHRLHCNRVPRAHRRDRPRRQRFAPGVARRCGSAPRRHSRRLSPIFSCCNGPNTNLAHNSIIYMLECQIGYVLACLRRLLKGEIRSLEVRREAQDRFNGKIQRRLKKTAWATGCSSWYLTAAGKKHHQLARLHARIQSPHARAEVDGLCHPIAPRWCPTGCGSA